MSAEIALLGPISVNGDTAVLSRRDRVVLAALAIRCGDVVSAERLADALWGDSPPPSWNKVVPGCILRLRRVLGPEAIETTGQGYRLAVGPEAIDVVRFERLLRRGRELLTLGEPDRAERTLDEALGLWRGPPMTDVDGWEPARIESERLAELKLETEECRLDAALRAGRHSEVLAQAVAAVAEAPLRERRWALLAIGQYQAGCQAEALRTLRRARTALLTELGLDPGPDLIALERSILRQDPALTIPASEAVGAADCPYLGLTGYDIADAEAFFGRDAEVAECLRRLERTGVLAVVGPSGCGKSSLIRAGVAAALARSGRRPFVLTPGSHPTPDLAGMPSLNAALVVDQFEEVFTICADPEARRRFFAGLVALAARCPVVIALRADHLGHLAGHLNVARLVEGGLYLLGPMNEDGLRAAVTGPADQAGLLLESGLVDLLVREVQGEPGALPLLSHALLQTWERRDGRTLTVAGYQASGGIRGCVAQSAEQLYESLPTEQRVLLRQVLLRLVSATNSLEAVRTRVPRRQLLTDPVRELMVERLVAARLVTTDQETVQIAHESLVRAWPRLSTWLDEDVEGQRILRHLSASADAWEAMGRPDSELYRGARLAHALDWQRSGHPDLTVTESDFVNTGAAVRDAAEGAAAQQARHRVRTRRRTRLLISGVAVLLVTAVVAGMLAVRQRQQREAADVAATVAEARRVDAASRNTPTVDLAMLLALQANELNDSPDTRAVLANLLSDHPALIRSFPTQGPVRSLVISPDGTTLVVGEGDSGTGMYRTDTLDRTSFLATVPAWTVEYRADGQQLLLDGRGSGGLGEGFTQLSAAVSDPAISSLDYLEVSGFQGQFVSANDAAYSDDGRFLAVNAHGLEPLSAATDSAVVVWDVGALDRPVMTVHRTFAYALALSPDGRFLYVSTREPALTVIDVATGRILHSIPLPNSIALAARPADSAVVDDIWDALADTLQVSPDGSTLAVAEGNDVALFDSTTLTPVSRLRGHSDLIRSLRFSHDGKLLASGSDDRTAVVWDLATGGPLLTLTGHADAVLALAFSPDDSTLYTGGMDRHVLVWDLIGHRQFVTRIVDSAPPIAHLSAAVPSHDGQAVVYEGSSASGAYTQFLDVTTGHLDASLPAKGADRLAAWSLPDDRQVVTVAGRILRVVDRGTNEIVKERTIASADITALAADPADGFVVIGDHAGEVERIDDATLTPTGPRFQFGQPVNAVAIGPDATAVALLDDNSYVVLDLTNGMLIRRGDLAIRPTAAELSPDGGRLAVGGSMGEVGLLDLGSHDWIRSPSAAHRQFVEDIAFSGDGRTIITSSFDGGVRLWDGNSGEPLAGLQVGRDTPAMATLPPDGRGALITSQDGAVYRLDTRFEKWAAFACVIAGRNLTTQEWKAVFADQTYRETCPTG